VIAKAATHDDVFAHHFALALRNADAIVADAYCPVRFARDDDAALDALLQHAEVVSIYGDDASVSSIRARARPEARVLPHGHGLSALYLPRESLRSESVALDTAQRVALDLVAYDQRGCLSPHFALVERGSVLDARAFCQLLAREALPALERMLPRGQLTTDDKAAAMQWRAAASARGELFANETSAVSYEANLPTRESPGARLLAVHDCDGPSDLAARLSSYGEHLKCLGIAGPRAAREPIMPLFASSERPPRLCRAGEMQTPPLAAPADGLPALHGFFTRQ
jgi:hypothetical protein